jgi:hypothetical protein
MAKETDSSKKNNIVKFNPDSYNEADEFTYIGDGQLGCKAEELMAVKEKIAPLDKEHRKHPTTPIMVNIPRLTVITTEYFDRFIEQNNLYDAALSESNDEQILHHFLEAELPGDLIDALKAFLAKVRVPLVVRPSIFMGVVCESCCQIEIFHCAGVYRAKLIPNNHPDLGLVD